MSSKEPRLFVRFQENAFQGSTRALLFFILGAAAGGIGVEIVQSLPGEWVAGTALILAGLVLIVIGIFLLFQRIIRRVNDTIEVSRALKEPGAPFAMPASGSGGLVEAWIVLPSNFRGGVSKPSGILLGSAILVIIGVVAGTVDLVAQPSSRSGTGFLYLALFALLGPLLLIMVDVQRPIPGLLAENPTHRVYLAEAGIEGPLYPYMSYRRERGTAVIRSPWFGLVRVRLPAPNQVPWRLLRVTTTRTRDGPNQDTSCLSISRAMLPMGFGGLQLTDGFLPAGGGERDRRLGSGMVVALRRADLGRVLWRASQAGSRLSAAFDQLTPIGKAAVLAARIDGNSRLSRPLSGPWFVWLPSPGSESELVTWLA